MPGKPIVHPCPVAQSRAVAPHVQSAVRAVQAKLPEPLSARISPLAKAASLPAPRAPAAHVQAANTVVQRAVAPPARAVQAALAPASKAPVPVTRAVIQQRKIALPELRNMILMIGPPGEKDDAGRYHSDLIRVLNDSLLGVGRSAAGRLPGEGMDDEDQTTVQEWVKTLSFDGVFDLADAVGKELLFRVTCKHFFNRQASPPAASPSSSAPAAAAEDKKPAPAKRAGPPSAWETESKKPIHSTCYVYNGRRWNAVGAQITGADDGHVEQQAYNGLISTPVALNREMYKASWLGFVQNAPPCPEQCRGFFLQKSKEGAPGFIFHIVGDHGGYCRDYKVAQTAPFDLYFYKGAFSIGRPAGAPADAPAAGPR